jgi:hypothetical protein
MTLGRCSDPDPGATNPKRSATIRRTQITEKRGYWTSLLGSLVGVHFGSVVPFKPNEKERIRYDTTITPSRLVSFDDAIVRPTTRECNGGSPASPGRIAHVIPRSPGRLVAGGPTP